MASKGGNWKISGDEDKKFSFGSFPFFSLDERSP